MDGLTIPESTPQAIAVSASGKAIAPLVNISAVPELRTFEQPLRRQLGASKGRVTVEQHLARLDLVMKNFPQSLWPSTAMFQNKFKGQTAIIVGGGPSLADNFHELSTQIRDLGDNCKVFAPNRSHDWLINGERKPDSEDWLRHPIIPNFGVLTDPSEFIEEYQTIDKRVIYLLTPMLHHRVLLKYLRAMASVFIWIPVYLNDGADVKLAAERYKGMAMHFVSGGSTVGLRTINLCLAMGFDQVDLYGFDSCYAPDPITPQTTRNFLGNRIQFEQKLYAYDKPYSVHEVVDSSIRCHEDGAAFHYRSNIMMAKQAMEFDDMLDQLPKMSVDGVAKQLRVCVHGDGLIPWLAWKASGANTLISHANPDAMTAKYGSGSWDYVEDRAV